MAKTKSIDKSKITEYGALRINQDTIMSRLNCHSIGKIIEFDPDTQLCTVELMQIKQLNNQLIPPAPITEVPLIIYGANNGHITLPDPVGTICTLFFFDRNIDNFKLTGEQYTPDTTRMHDYTDCVALTTFKTLANPLTNYDMRAVHIFNKEIIEEIIYNSYIKVYGNEILLNTTGNEKASNISIVPGTINTTTEDINTSCENINTNSEKTINLATEDYKLEADKTIKLNSKLTGEVNIDDKINIKNATFSLATLISTLITTIEAITTIQGDSVSNSSKNALEAVKANFLELLK